MSIESSRDLVELREIGRVVAVVLRQLRDLVRPGVTTARLDAAAARLLRRHGARSAPYLTYRFPGAICISVNEEAAHGVPGERRIAAGDLVKLDVSAERGGYFADAAVTVTVPPVSAAAARLKGSAKIARDAGIAAARVGAPLYAVGEAAARAAAAGGFTVVPDLPGHGVGRALHEAPTIPQYFDPSLSDPIAEGLVFTVEPHLTWGQSAIEEARDGWTLRTTDRAWVAVFEHTVVATREGPLVVTALENRRAA
jgi:methionyl aminopeptidase